LRGAGNCIECNAHLHARVDYGALTDALVWTYLFEEIGLPLLCNNSRVSFLDVVAILPVVRTSYPVTLAAAYLSILVT